MAVFPDDPKPSEGYELVDVYYTFESGPYEAGTSVTGKGREFPLAVANIKYPKLPASEFNSLISFYHAMRGRFGTFTFFDFAGWDAAPVGVLWPYLYVGVGDGTTATFDLPMKSTSTYTLKVAGVSKTPVTHFTFGTGTGTDGKDRITFTAGNIPSAGQIVTLENATGRRGFKARLSSDSQTLQRFVNNLTSTGISVKEVR